MYKNSMARKQSGKKTGMKKPMVKPSSIIFFIGHLVNVSVVVPLFFHGLEITVHQGVKLVFLHELRLVLE